MAMSVKNSIKSALDIVLGSPSIYAACTRIFRRPLFPYVIAITYHDTPRHSEANLRRQFEWYRSHFVNCGVSGLRELLSNGTWPSEKAGLIITFDDGLRSNFDVALPLLEEYGFTGWFMIPPAFIDSEPSKQANFAQRRLIDVGARPGAAVGRIAMSWEELRRVVAGGHHVSCHSMNHVRLEGSLSDTELAVEIRGAKRVLEDRLGRVVDSFTWVGGEEWAYSRKAYQVIAGSDYEFVFCTNCAPIKARQQPWFLERYHVDPDNDLDRIRTVLGGLYDLMYFRKRRRIAAKLRR